MNKSDKLKASDPWETGELGRDENYVRRATPEREAAVHEALGLQLISIRLQKRLIEDLKFIARVNGVGYQPLVRDILDRFVVGEIKNIVREMRERREREEAVELGAAVETRAGAAGARRTKKAA